jgi:hypothetical protein
VEIGVDGERKRDGASVATIALVNLDPIQRKPQLCRPFLAILFAEFVLSPLEVSKFLSRRFEETAALAIVECVPS